MTPQQPPDQESLLSRSEASTAGEGEDLPYRHPTPYPLSRRPWSSGTNLSWILNILLLLTTTILALQLSRGDHFQHTGDINGLAPRFTQRIQLFHPSSQATASIGNPEAQAATEDFWRTFAPDGFGLQNLKDYSPKRYPELAPPTMEPGGYNLVDTSMAHQLHCLFSIMEAYNDLAGKVNETVMGVGMEHMPPRRRGKEKHPHHDHSWHLGHCFDYIRQGIMCCGDTALEGAATTFPDGVKGSDGWNAKHVCKDYEEVKSWIVSQGPDYQQEDGEGD